MSRIVDFMINNEGKLIELIKSKENEVCSQVNPIPGPRKVSELSKVEMEVLLIDIVQRVLDNRNFFDEIGADVFDCLVDAELIDFKEEE